MSLPRPVENIKLEVETPETVGRQTPDTEMSGLQIPEMAGIQAPGMAGVQTPDMAGFPTADMADMQTPDMAGLQTPDMAGFPGFQTRSMAGLLAQAGIPAFKCPKGTKMYILHLGNLECDEGWILRAGGSSTLSQPKVESKRREMVVLACLIDYPGFGLILFETGCPEELEVHWPAPVTDLFPRTTYSDAHKLPAAILAATGNRHTIGDVKAVLMGHLHLDHAGGLEHFLDSEVPVHVHEDEFKHACWAVGTRADLGVYLPHYMQLSRLNWQTFCEPVHEIFQGITLRHSPGHTPGLCVLQLNLERDGTFIWTTDQFHVRENYELAQPQGWLARDHNAWVRSTAMIKRLQRLFNARLVFGHDKETAVRLMEAQPWYE